jgi:hypothetical protein
VKINRAGLERSAGGFYGARERAPEALLKIRAALAAERVLKGRTRQRIRPLLAVSAFGLDAFQRAPHR